MYVEWLKRAHQGGLQLIVALGVTNMYWATRVMTMGMSPGACIDDESACLQQVEEMKSIAQKNPDWMGIAYSPKEARELILRGKLAVVLGVEMDNFGNFKDSEYIWTDNYPMPPSKPLVNLPDDMPAATQMMQSKLKEYYKLGIRAVTPLHYINGVFGGTAQFRYEFALINHAFVRKTYELTDGVNDGIAYNIGIDGVTFMNYFKTLLGNSGESFNQLFINGNSPDMPSRCVNCTFPTLNSTMCATGLTSKGQMMFTELMRKGFIVDVDHASIPSADNILSLASTYKYPVVSSHSDPRELSFKANYAAKFIGTDDEKVQLFGTAVLGNLSHEGQISAQNMERVAKSDGIAGVLILPYRKLTFQHPENRVINDCDGSSKTWAQMYLYALVKMKKHGIALSTDRGAMNEFAGPRFGVWASYRLKDEPLASLNKGDREKQRYAQSQAVTYANPFNLYHSYLFENGGVDQIEEDAWKAVAYYHIVGANPLSNEYKTLPDSKKVPLSAYLDHPFRIESFVQGFYMNYAEANALAAGSIRHERLAAYCVKNGITPQQLPDAGWHNDDWLNQNYHYLKSVWTLWQRMTASTQNEPLRRCKTGTREWDFNLEGLAHYGLLPDFLQDCKNVGVTTKQLQPLFNSAEDFIRMWEKTEVAKLNIP